MIRLRLEPSPQFEQMARDPQFSVEHDDLPMTGETWEFYDIPRAGDSIEHPDTGQGYTVVRVVWFAGGEKPWLIVGV